MQVGWRKGMRFRDHRASLALTGIFLNSWRVGGAAGAARVEDKTGGLTRLLQQDRSADAETSRTGDSAVGGADGGEASPTVNLRGSRVKHGRRPTNESQRTLAPQNPEDIA